MSGCIQRNAIPTKIELEQTDGSRIPPEKCLPEDFADLPDSERTALFALSQWCGGMVSSFLQLNLNQAAELLKLLHEVPCFFPANEPERLFQWKEGNLLGVSEFICLSESESPQRPKIIREISSEEPIEPIA